MEKNDRIKKLVLGILVLCVGMVFLAGCGSVQERIQQRQKKQHQQEKKSTKFR